MAFLILGRLLALLIVPLLVIPSFNTSRLAGGSGAAPATGCLCAACSTGYAAAPSTSAGSVATGKVVEHEWLNGSRRESVVREALTMEEYRRLEAVLRRMGYKPAPEEAVAVRFVRESGNERNEHIIVVIPFTGELGKSAFVVIALKPFIEGLSFQLEEAGILRLVAKVPEGRPSKLLPTRAFTSSSSCPPCTYLDYQCVELDIGILLVCCGFCIGVCHGVCPGNPTCFIACLIVCAIVWCPNCYVLACRRWVETCVDCLPSCIHADCCYNCPPCLNTPACLGG